MSRLRAFRVFRIFFRDHRLYRSHHTMMRSGMDRFRTGVLMSVSFPCRMVMRLGITKAQE